MTERFARRAAAAIADELLNWVSDREREAHEKAIYGKDYGGRGGSGYVSAETFAKVNAELQPAYDLIREWCGAEAVARHDQIVLLEAEIASLRAEVVRPALLVVDAAEELRTSGRPRVAGALERSLGADPKMVRASKRVR